MAELTHKKRARMWAQSRRIPETIERFTRYQREFAPADTPLWQAYQTVIAALEMLDIVLMQAASQRDNGAGGPQTGADDA